MKTNRLFVMLAFVIVVAFVSLVLPRANLAGAALGNSGVPVNCSSSGTEGLPNNSAVTLTCFAADGTAFVGNTTVPTSYYLMVTDVVLDCNNGAWSRVHLRNALSTGAFDTYLVISEPAASPTVHLGFVTPYLVVPAGHRLDAYTFNGVACHIGASGLLVTNVTYIPSVSR